VKPSVALFLVAAVACSAGCGGGGSGSAQSKSEAATPSGGYLEGAELQRQLGNAFRKGLYRISVMTQRTEDAKDLGQPLPTGVVQSVRCTAAGTQPAGGGMWPWTCSVAWRTVAGTPQTTRYDVRLRKGRCFAAGATPERRLRYDATIKTYSQDPLNALVSLRPGC
jgi:hypothetical protein